MVILTGRGFDSRQLHKGLYIKYLGSFCYPLKAQDYQAFTHFNATQACIYWANAILHLRNTL